MEVIKKYHITRILVIVLVIVSLVAYSCYTAPKAHAEAVTATLTVAFLSLALIIMSSLGVTLHSPTVSDGIEYISEPFDDFIQTKGYSSTTDYLYTDGRNFVSLIAPAYAALNVAKSVYDIIAEFCTSFFSDNNVVSGGDTVGASGGNISSEFTDEAYYFNNISFSYPSDDSVTISFGSVSSADDSSYSSPFGINIPTSDVTFPLSVSVVSASSSVLSSDFLGIFVAGSNARAGSYDIVDYTSGIAVNDTVYINSTAYPYVFLGICCTDEGDIYSSCDVTLQISQDVVIPGSFTLTPSDNVISPPSVGLGQTYSIPAVGVTPTDTVYEAIDTAVQPITSADGLSSTASVAGTAVSAEWAWLYEGVESIKNNTSDDRHGTDFIPSSTTMDFGFWHYVPDWISSVGVGFSMLVGVVTSLPSIMLAPLYGILVLGIVVALFHKLWGS